MTTTYELIIQGQVQHVGFRDRVEHIGTGLGIDGIVFNHTDETVRIIANFRSESEIDSFKSAIYLIENIDNLINITEISTIPYNIYIDFPKGMNKIASDDLFELNKKLDEGVKYIKLIFENLKSKDIKLDMQLDKLNQQSNILKNLEDSSNKQTEVLNNQTKVLNKQTEVLNKQTEVLEKILEIISKNKSF